MSAIFIGWSLNPHAICGCGVAIVVLESIATDVYMTCTRCEATWQAEMVG